MPLYDYECPACGAAFTHFWRSLHLAATSAPPACPTCGHEPSQRVVSSVAVLGGLGGMTPSEQAAENRQAERAASVLPRETIDKFHAARKKTPGGSS